MVQDAPHSPPDSCDAPLLPGEGHNPRELKAEARRRIDSHGARNPGQILIQFLPTQQPLKGGGFSLPQLRGQGVNSEQILHPPPQPCL